MINKHVICATGAWVGRPKWNTTGLYWLVLHELPMQTMQTGAA